MYDAGTDIRIYTLHDEKTGHTEGYACSDGHFVVDITRVQNLRKEKKLYDAGFRIFPTVGTEHGEHYHECRIGRLPLAYYKIYFEKTVILGKEKNIECREKKYYVIKENLRTYYFDPESEMAIRSTDEQRISDVKIKLEADARGHRCPDYKAIDDKNIEKINKTIKEERKVVDALGEYEEDWYGKNYRFNFITIKPSLPKAEDFRFLEKWEEMFNAGKSEKIFEEAEDSKDSVEKLEQCNKNKLKLEEELKENLYIEATDLINKDNFLECKKAEKIFRDLGEYKDSVEYLNKCEQKIDELKLKEELLKAKQKKKMIILLVIVFALITIGIGFIIKNNIEKNIENEQKLQEIEYKNTMIDAVKKQAYEWTYDEVLEATKNYESITVSNFDLYFEEEDDKGDEYYLQGRFSYDVDSPDSDNTYSLSGTVTITGEWYDEKHEAEMSVVYDKKSIYSS